MEDMQPAIQTDAAGQYRSSEYYLEQFFLMIEAAREADIGTTPTRARRWACLSR